MSLRFSEIKENCVLLHSITFRVSIQYNYECLTSRKINVEFCEASRESGLLTYDYILSTYEHLYNKQF